MEYFSIIYTILKAIEKSMDAEEFDNNSISPEFLHVSMARWEIIMGELVRNRYITGVYLIPIAGREIPSIKIGRPALTIQGGGISAREYDDEKGVQTCKRYQRYRPDVTRSCYGL